LIWFGGVSLVEDGLICASYLLFTYVEYESAVSGDMRRKLLGVKPISIYEHAIVSSIFKPQWPILSRCHNRSALTARQITNPPNAPNSTLPSRCHISISKTINITPDPSTARLTTSISRARVPVRDDRIVQYYRADAAYGELKNIESEEDGQNTGGRQHKWRPQKEKKKSTSAQARSML
jgi:hypothetical protein